MADQNRDGTIHTVNLVTQCLSIPIVTIFVALRFGIRAWYKQFVLVEDSMALDPTQVEILLLTGLF